MKLLVDNFKIKAYYKEGCFYDTNDEKIDDSKIEQIIMNYQEFQKLSQLQQGKNKKKKIKDE